MELLLRTCRTSRLTYFVSINVCYNILETLYQAYYTIGLLAYIFALVSYLPFVMSYGRMIWRDSESRRFIFYRVCMKIWLMGLAFDCWVFMFTMADVEEVCDYAHFMPDHDEIKKEFQFRGYLSREVMQNLCYNRIATHNVFNIFCH